MLTYEPRSIASPTGLMLTQNQKWKIVVNHTCIPQLHMTLTTLYTALLWHIPILAPIKTDSSKCKPFSGACKYYKIVSQVFSKIYHQVSDTSRSWMIILELGTDSDSSNQTKRDDINRMHKWPSIINDIKQTNLHLITNDNIHVNVSCCINRSLCTLVKSWLKCCLASHPNVQFLRCTKTSPFNPSLYI